MFVNCSKQIAALANTVALSPVGRGAIPRALARLFPSLFNDCYVVSRHGVKMLMSASAIDFFTTMARNDWAHDYWVLDTCASLLPDEGVFYDVGANVGYMSLEMTRKRPDCSAIISFEPQGELVRNLRRSAELNGIENVIVMGTCVGDRSGEVSFQRERHSVHAHVSYSDSPRVGKHNSSFVSQVVIDDLVESGELPPPDVIKIDVEGYEYNVLLGARSTIKAHQPHVVFELSDEVLKFAHSVQIFFELLSSLADYDYEIAVGSYRDAVPIQDTTAFSQAFMAAPHLTNILARSRTRGDAA